MNRTRPASRSPYSPTVADGGPAPAPLYSRPGITVTVRFFTVGRSRYAVGELTQLRTARGSPDRLVRRSVGVSAGMVATVGLLLGLTGALQRLGVGAYLTLGVAATLPVLIAAVGRRCRPPAYQLWGRHQGADLLLFSSDEEREFGQVTRALLRAREAARLGALDGPLAADPGWPSR